MATPTPTCICAATLTPTPRVDPSVYFVRNSTDKFVACLIVYCSFAIVSVTAFILLKTKYSMYKHRCLKLSMDNPRNIGPPPTGTLSWLKPTMSYSDDDMFGTHGLDAVMMVMFLRRCANVTSVMAFWGLIVLMPVYATSTSIPSYIDGIEILTISTISNSNARFTATIISEILFSAAAWHMLYSIYKEYFRFRMMYKATPTPNNHTVVIWSIPSCVRPSQVKQKLTELFHGEILEIWPIFRGTEIKKKMSNLKKASYHLERAVAKRILTNQEPMIRPKKGFFHVSKTGSTDKVNAIEHYGKAVEVAETKLIDLKLHLAAIAEVADKQDTPFAGAVFVTFKTRMAAMKASRMFFSSKANEWLSGPAPEPDDVNWQGLGISATNRVILGIAVQLIMIGLVILWAVPTVSIAILQNSLTASGTVFNQVVTGILPPFLIFCTFQILPFLIRVLVSMQGLRSKSDMANAVSSTFALFMSIDVFFGFIATAVVLQVQRDHNFNALFSDIRHTLELIAVTYPAQSTFFVNFVILWAFMFHPFYLLMPFNLIYRAIMRKWFCHSVRDYVKADSPGQFHADRHWAVNFLMFFIMINYCCIAPLVLPFSAIYFWMGCISIRYKLLYVYMPKFEGGGNMWPTIFTFCSFAIMIFHLLLFCYFAIQGFITGVVFSVILAILSVAHWKFVQDRFEVRAVSGALENCVITAKPTKALESCYQQPFYLRPQERFQAQTNILAFVEHGLVLPKDNPWEFKRVNQSLPTLHTTVLQKVYSSVATPKPPGGVGVGDGSGSRHVVGNWPWSESEPGLGSTKAGGYALAPTSDPELRPQSESERRSELATQDRQGEAARWDTSKGGPMSLAPGEGIHLTIISSESECRDANIVEWRVTSSSAFARPSPDSDVSPDSNQSQVPGWDSAQPFPISLAGWPKGPASPQSPVNDGTLSPTVRVLDDEGVAGLFSKQDLEFAGIEERRKVSFRLDGSRT